MLSQTISSIPILAAVFFQSVDWESVAKTWGPLGIGFVLFVILVWQGAKMAKTMLSDTIADARKERDASRQLLKEQAAEFTAHITRENNEFREALRDVVTAFERTGRRK